MMNLIYEILVLRLGHISNIAARSKITIQPMNNILTLKKYFIWVSSDTKVY
jgi:hypothetical protein